MASEAVSTRSVIRVRGKAATVDDDLVVEEPVEFRLDGTALAVVMRTPGNDAELALGFAITEGIVNGPDEVASVVDLEKGDGMSGWQKGSPSIRPGSSATSTPRPRAESVARHR